MNIYITSGFIGSGKSYWSSHFSFDKGALIISKDKIREMIFGKYNYSIYLEALVDNIAKSVYKTIVKSGQFDVIVDEVHLKRKDRRIWYDLAQEEGVKANFHILWFCESNNNVDYRMEDSRRTPREEWQKVLDKMKNEFEEPLELDIPGSKLYKIKREEIDNLKL